MSTIDNIESAENPVKQEILDFMSGKVDSITVRAQDTKEFNEAADELFPTVNLNYRVSNLEETLKKLAVDLPTYDGAVNRLIPKHLRMGELIANASFINVGSKENAPSIDSDLKICVNGEEVTQRTNEIFYTPEDGSPVLYDKDGACKVSMNDADFTKARFSSENGVYTIDFESN